MNRFKLSARLMHNQYRNLIRVMSGLPLTTASLGSMTLDQDDVDIARDWLKESSGWDNCEIVKQYEDEFSHWNGSKYAYAFMGGRVALSAIIFALGLNPGDEVILPGYTCVVVPNAFHFAGVKTVYSDIELETFGLDASKVEDKLTSKTRAILLQHLYGLVCRDYQKLVDIAERNNLYIIEDCAQSTGAEYQGIKVGNLGHVAFYSSEQSKIFNTIRGGVAVTSNEEIASRISVYWKSAPFPGAEEAKNNLYSLILNYYLYKHKYRWWLGDLINIWYGDKKITSTTPEEEMGIRPANYGQKMSDPVAALGLNQLRKVDYYNKIRRQKAKRWDRWCEDNNYKKPKAIEGSEPVYLRYPVMVEPQKKEDRSWGVRQLGVDIGVWFTSNAHPSNISVTGCPNANKAVNQCINFPCL